MTLLNYCLLFTVLAMVKGAIKDLTLTNDPCSEYDSCKTSDWFRMCSCDDACFEFGTCCWDTPGISVMTQDNLEHWCNREGTETPVFAKRTCASSYTEDEQVVAGCVSNKSNGGNLIENTLVSSHATKTTYWNLNCAICNHEEAKNLAYWNVHVLCPARHWNRNITRDVVQENLVYREQNIGWGLDLDGEFVNCTMTFSQPLKLSMRLKYCAPNLLDKCPPDYHDGVVKKKCASNYYGERKDRNSQRHFKNVHCAICNGLKIEELSCFARTYNRVSHGATSDTIKVTFESDDWKKIVMRILRCGSNLEYDPFQDRCRNSHGRKWNGHNSASIDRLPIFAIILSLLLICVRNKRT